MESFSKVLLLVNPLAGGGRGRYWAPLLEEALKRKGLSVHCQLLEPYEDLNRVIEECSADLILVAAGDGTFHKVINAWINGEKRPPLSLIPIGTGNVFAANMGIPMRPLEALEALLKGQIRRLDLGSVDGQLFHSTLGVGFDAYVVHKIEEGSPNHRFKRIFGALTYIFEALRHMRHYQWSQVHLKALLSDGSSQTWDRNSWLILINNMAAYAGGFRVTPDARPDDGLLDLCVLPAQKKTDYLLFAFLGLLGLHLRHPDVLYEQIRQVSITAERPLPSQLDGERGPQTPLTAQVIPSALPVLLPATPIAPHATPIPVSESLA
ncbi:MAG: diacylglycerol kinase family lipid kinase [Armatimonadota bacterium]|nr:diacylglycerol kinase family lipid kinase [Armatimonadota bacterium]